MTIAPMLEEMQRAGFPIGGEPLVAIDLVDTLMLAADPAVDLLEEPEQADTWWRAQAARLPDGPTPDQASVRRLRAAIRDLLDSHLEHRSPRATSIDDVNAAAASVPTSVRMIREEGGIRLETRWHDEQGGNPRLATVAREVIELMSDADRMGRLRRCANPECSMLFIAQNKRRQWCADNICGNRARVARHYQRQKAATGGPESESDAGEATS